MWVWGYKLSEYRDYGGSWFGGNIFIYWDLTWAQLILLFDPIMPPLGEEMLNPIIRGYRYLGKFSEIFLSFVSSSSS